MSESPTTGQADRSGLTPAERAVVEVLCAEWQDPLRCTTIDQAMERLGMVFSHTGRLRVAEVLRADRRACAAMRWALPTYVLTNDEKLVARCLLRTWRDSAEIPPPATAAAGAEVAGETAEAAFETLRWLGMLVARQGRWALAGDPRRFLAGLGFAFHEVVLPAPGARFNTNCALDFFLLTHRPTRARLLAELRTGTLPELVGEGMSEKMVTALRALVAAEGEPTAGGSFSEGERAILNDACGWSDTRIRIVMERGVLSEVEPESVWYLRGGG